MSRSVASKGAILAAIVTLFVVPLSMFLAYGPRGDDAAAGFEQAELTATSTVAWTVIAVTIFVVTFAAAVVVLARGPAGGCRPRD